MRIRTSGEIRAKIIAKKSFWVASENERKSAILTAKTLQVPYHTSADDRGGFYICFLRKVKKVNA